jgi:hypothetical protein
MRSVEAHPDCDALQCFLHFFASLVTRLGLCGLGDAIVGNVHSIFLHRLFTPSKGIANTIDAFSFV